jgi:hypothetical protein
MKRGNVLLADFVEALTLLRAEDPETRSEIAAMLGLELEGVAAVPLAPAPGDLLQTRGRRDDAPAPERPPVEQLPIRVRRTETRSPERERARPAITAPPLDAPPSGEQPPAPDPEPLLQPRWTRGIVSAALASADRGAVDVARAVEILAREEPLDPVPVLPRATLRNGAQVLLDRSAAMTPFFRDQAVLVEQLRPLIGAHRLEVLRFAGSPERGAGRRGPRTWRAYEPPRPNTPVLLVSDLGAGHAPLATDTASAAEWSRFAAAVEASRCPLVALVPYPRRRLPRGLPRTLRMVRWDRGTTARDARRARGRLRRDG